MKRRKLFIEIIMFFSLVTKTIALGESENRTFLGIYGVSVDDTTRRKIGLEKETTGIIITNVIPNSPAEKCGIREGDVILKCDGINIKTFLQLVNYIRKKKINDTITLLIFRKGRKIEFFPVLEALSYKIERNVFLNGREWEYKVIFVNSGGDTTDSSIVKLTIPGGEFHSQIKAEWSYNKKEELKEVTGVVETDEIFLHPPRREIFQFTQFAPFPQVLLPLKEKEKWEFKLMIGKKWGTQKEIEVNTYYEIMGQKEVKTLLKNLFDCWEIYAKSESKAGIYKAIFYFHPKYGFVRWEYTKPNGDQVIFDLEEISGFD